MFGKGGYIFNMLTNEPRVSLNGATKPKEDSKMLKMSTSPRRRGSQRESQSAIRGAERHASSHRILSSPRSSEIDFEW